jgi:hypothetical protein
VQIVLDLHPAVHAGGAPGDSREWAIRVAASLAQGWIGQGAEVNLLFDGGFVAACGGSARVRSAAVLDALARVSSGGTRDLATLLSLPECLRFRRGLRVVVTTDIALGRLGAEGFPGTAARFVVLKAGAFTSDMDDDAPGLLPMVPWIWIDGPARVAARLSRAAKEVTLGG